MKIHTFLKLLSAGICGLAAFLWGSLDGLLRALIVFMVIDYITGLMEAYHRKALSSRTGFMGIFRKGVMLLVVAVGHILDTQVFGAGAVCRSAVIGFYLANEGLSILENAGELGVPLPPVLVRALEQLRHRADNQTNQEDNDDE